MLSFFSPRDVLDEILDLIESVSKGLPTYSFICVQNTQSNTLPYKVLTVFYLFIYLLLLLFAKTGPTRVSQ